MILAGSGKRQYRHVIHTLWDRRRKLVCDLFFRDSRLMIAAPPTTFPLSSSSRAP